MPEATELDGLTVLLIVTAVMAAGCGIGVLVYFLIKKKREGAPTDPTDSAYETEPASEEDIPAEVITEAEDASSRETADESVIVIDEAETTNSDENSVDKEI